MAPHEIWPFSPRAFIADTRHLLAAERDAYFLLLCHYWLNRKMPETERELARIAGVTLYTWTRHIRPRIAPFFFNVGKPGGWKHKRTERELAHAAEYHRQQRRNAMKRWHPVDNGEADFYGSQGVRQNKSNGLADAVAMPSSKTINSPSVARERSADVDKSPDLCSDLPVVLSADPPRVTNKQRPHMPAYQRAQQNVLRTLLRDLGEAAYAEAIEILAASPTLLDRATKIEQRKPGGGVVTVLDGLRKVVNDEF